MARLSGEHLADLDERGYSMKRAGYSRSVAVKQAELHELVRGYRRTVELEDMLREWVADMKHGWAGKNGGKMHETCGYCFKDIPAHYPECLVQRTEALLAEGDE